MLVRQILSQQYIKYNLVTVRIVLILVLSISPVLTQEAGLLEKNSDTTYIGCFTERTDLFKESVYSRIPQTCVEICEVKSYEYAILFAEKCFCSKVIHEEDRQDDQLCNRRCSANKSQYCGGIGVHSYYSTAQINKAIISNFKVLKRTENSLIVEWRSANESIIHMNNGEVQMKKLINNFLINSNVVHTYSTFPVFKQPQFVIEKSQRNLELTDLHPGTTYNISIEALCEDQSCGEEFILSTTLVGIPSPKPKPPRVLKKSANTILVEIDPIKNDNGPVSKLMIIVEKVDSLLSQEFDENLLGNYEKSQESGVPYYIAAELDYNAPEAKAIQFMVGDNKYYGSYQNVPLEKIDESENAIDYHISLGVVSSLDGVTKVLYSHSGHDQHSSIMDDFSYLSYNKGQDSIIALIVTCSIFAVLVILSAITYFYLRFSRFKERNALTYNQEMNEINNE